MFPKAMKAIRPVDNATAVGFNFSISVSILQPWMQDLLQVTLQAEMIDGLI